MELKNNSSHEWLGYNCGNCLVDIKANLEFETDDISGRIILRNLGCPQWITKIEEKKEVKKIFCEFCSSRGIKHTKECTRPK